MIDSRENNYDGHADIKLGFTVIAGEPLAPEIVLTMRERNKRLAGIANYHLDPIPSSDTWDGPLLRFQMPEL